MRLEDQVSEEEAERRDDLQANDPAQSSQATDRHANRPGPARTRCSAYLSPPTVPNANVSGRTRVYAKCLMKGALTSIHTLAFILLEKLRRSTAFECNSSRALPMR
ncbi:hypothetical protein HO173_000673 [Letharia columbiana]|uniref:Uncharacterized protein n=1 Tax=Letharia columbiana TaxID=112416 RepID=A0A8H6G5L1_9LECA|nr:uncharacterized protein HO173_000673 [Letharia columbiana]KAF6240881.1 hypothetical protein HO173_000673 [Letharia columbiana]